ncbi:hypothetical protein AAG906_023254 [Vitis piasezkii]
MANNNVLPDDLIVEILLRLAVKCLKRFSCVCKAWYAVTRDPVFMAKHLDQTNSSDDEYSFSMLSNETLDHVPTRISMTYLMEPCNQGNQVSSKDNLQALAILGTCAYVYVFRFLTLPIRKAELYTLSSDSWRQMDLDVPAYIDRTNIINSSMKGRIITDTYTDSDKNLQHLGDERVWGLRSHGPVSGVERQGGLFMESSSGELLLYNRLTRQLKNLGVFSCARRPSIQRMQVIIYKESLVSLNGRHEDEDGIVRPHTHSYP